MGPYFELFWSIFSRIWTDNGKIQIISSYLVQIQENASQNNSKHGQFWRGWKIFVKIADGLKQLTTLTKSSILVDAL